MHFVSVLDDAQVLFHILEGCKAFIAEEGWLEELADHADIPFNQVSFFTGVGYGPIRVVEKVILVDP